MKLNLCSRHWGEGLWGWENQVRTGQPSVGTPFTERFEKRLDQGFRAEVLLPLNHFSPQDCAAQCFRFASRSVSSFPNAGGRSAPVVLAPLNQSHRGQCHSALGTRALQLGFCSQIKTCQPCRASRSAGFSCESWMLQLTWFLKLGLAGAPLQPCSPQKLWMLFFFFSLNSNFYIFIPEKLYLNHTEINFIFF